jgi:hypothetical protein
MIEAMINNCVKEEFMLSALDKSNYLRGLLVICRLDQDVSDYEKRAIVRLSKILGFDPHFCSEAVEELIENPYISENAPVFTKQEIGKAFIADALKLAFSDNDFHINELRWIRNVAKINGVRKEYWLDLASNLRLNKKVETPAYAFEIESYLKQEEEFKN